MLLVSLKLKKYFLQDRIFLILLHNNTKFMFVTNLNHRSSDLKGVGTSLKKLTSFMQHHVNFLPPPRLCNAIVSRISTKSCQYF